MSATAPTWSPIVQSERPKSEFDCQSAKSATTIVAKAATEASFICDTFAPVVLLPGPAGGKLRGHWLCRDPNHASCRLPKAEAN